ncbi:MAG: AI-2E family transporter [Clostridia bacterium]
MKKEKNDIKLWLFWFSLAVAIIAAYNILGNLAGVAQIIGNILGAIMPFCIGLLIAYILYMPCRSIETLFKKSKKKGFVNKHARGLSILTTYIIALIVIVIILNVIIPIVVQSLSDLFTNLPGYYNSVTEKINELPEDNILRSEKATEIINNIKNIDFTALFNMERIQQYIKSFISAMETILDAFIAVIVSVYILAQRNAIIRFLSKFTKAVASKNAYEKIKKYFMKSNSVFFKFLTSQVLDAILVGVLVSVALSILQVKYAVLLGFMIGLFNLIPYFGAIVAVVIAILITVLTGGIGKALLMTVVVVILQQIDANIINPKIVGDSLEISQLLVIFAVTLGGAYFGVIGMFLAVPVATVIKLIIEDFIEEREKSKEI